jgi:hypothetical protein
LAESAGEEKIELLGKMEFEKKKWASRSRLCFIVVPDRYCLVRWIDACAVDSVADCAQY